MTTSRVDFIEQKNTAPILHSQEKMYKMVMSQ